MYPALDRVSIPLSFLCQPEKRRFTFSRCSAQNRGSSQKSSFARQRHRNQSTIAVELGKLIFHRNCSFQRMILWKFLSSLKRNKDFQFATTRDPELGSWSVPVKFAVCNFDCDVLCDHLCYRWMIYCPPKAIVCQVEYNSTEGGQNLSQKMRYGGSGWTGMKRIFRFALKNGSFIRRPVSREIPTLLD